MFEFIFNNYATATGLTAENLLKNTAVATRLHKLCLFRFRYFTIQSRFTLFNRNNGKWYILWKCSRLLRDFDYIYFTWNVSLLQCILPFMWKFGLRAKKTNSKPACSQLFILFHCWVQEDAHLYNGLLAMYITSKTDNIMFM